MHWSWGAALAHETLLLLRVRDSAGWPALHHEGRKALLLPLLRVLVCRILRHLCPAHRWGNTWGSAWSYWDWTPIVSGVVIISLVANDRNPIHSSLSEKGNILAYVIRKGQRVCWLQVGMDQGFIQSLFFFFRISVQLVFYWHHLGTNYHHMLAKMTLQLYSLSTCIL